MCFIGREKNYVSNKVYLRKNTHMKARLLLQEIYETHHIVACARISHSCIFEFYELEAHETFMHNIKYM